VSVKVEMPVSENSKFCWNTMFSTRWLWLLALT